MPLGSSVILGVIRPLILSTIEPIPLGASIRIVSPSVSKVVS